MRCPHCRGSITPVDTHCAFCKQELEVPTLSVAEIQRMERVLKIPAGQLLEAAGAAVVHDPRSSEEFDFGGGGR